MNPTFDQRMSRTLHVTLCNFLQFALPSPAHCYHDFSFSQQFLESRGCEDLPGALQWLRDHGGNCDCEVILNTVPWGASQIASK